MTSPASQFRAHPGIGKHHNSDLQRGLKAARLLEHLRQARAVAQAAAVLAWQAGAHLVAYPTKNRHKFLQGDFKTVHRDDLITATERAAQQGYHDVEQAANELLQLREKQTQQTS